MEEMKLMRKINKHTNHPRSLDLTHRPDQITIRNEFDRRTGGAAILDFASIELMHGHPLQFLPWKLRVCD